jgi:hypothetical protein
MIGEQPDGHPGYSRDQFWVLQSTFITQPFIFSELPETEPEPL